MTVRLNSGGPLMTIVCCIDGLALCAWADRTFHARSCWFRLAMLTIIGVDLAGGSS